MFEFVRKHNRMMQLLLLILVVPAFVLVGVSSYDNGNAGAVVAQVDGEKITQVDWDQEINRRGQMLRQRDPNFDVKLLEEPEQKYRVLEDLVNQQVLNTAVQKMRLGASDRQVAEAIAQDPSIAALRDAKGNMDLPRYQQLLASNGLTPAMYEAQVRQSMGVQKLQMSIFATAPQVPALRDALLQAAMQTREVQLARFPSSDYAAKVNLSDAQVEQYYQAHAANFAQPEAASIEYVVLNAEAAVANLSFSDAELKQYYEQNQARFAGSEERRASHILIRSDKSDSAADRQKAKAKAEAILLQVKANPGSFAALAKEKSEDPGSAANGGDLDFFARGAMDKAFETAVYALNKDQISAVVASDFGYHIIKLTDIRGQGKGFEALKPEILAALKAEQGGKKFAELSEKFSNAVEDNDDLAAVAKQFNVPLRRADGLRRTGAHAGQVDPLLQDSKVLAAVFSDEVLSKKRNTPAIDVGKSTLLSAHLVAYTPAKTKPLAEVKEQARNLALAEQAQALAQAAGQAKLAAWKGGAAAQLDTPITVSRQQTQNLAPTLLEALMKADTSTLPAWVGIALPNQAGYVVAKISKVSAGDASAESEQLRAQVGQMYQQTLSNAEAAAFIQNLRAQYKTKIKVAKPHPSNAASVPAAQAEADAL